jgi:hypothetical protein
MRGSWDLGSHLADTEAILSIVEAKKNVNKIQTQYK